MRSVSLLGAAWRCVGRCRESLSPGKVKELGRLAGEAGMEPQKDPPFCRGLLGAKGSLPKAGGEFNGETAPGLGLPRGRGPRLARASLAAASWLAAAFRGLSSTFILGTGSAVPSGSLLAVGLPGCPGPASRALLLGGGREGPGADVPDILSASAWLEAAAEETSTGGWCLTGCGIREGLLLLWPGPPTPLELPGPLVPGPLGAVPPPPLPPLPPPPLWFLWYSIGDVKAETESPRD